MTTPLDLQVAQMLLDERSAGQVGERAREASEKVGKGWIVSRSRSSGAARTARVAWPIQSPVSGPTA